MEWAVAETQALPPLPRTCAFGSGALVGGTFYVAGGIETPDATTALATLWALDVAKPETGWKELPACPGPGRMLAVAGATADTFIFWRCGAECGRGREGAAHHPARRLCVFGGGRLEKTRGSAARRDGGAFARAADG